MRTRIELEHSLLMIGLPPQERLAHLEGLERLRILSGRFYTFANEVVAKLRESNRETRIAVENYEKENGTLRF